MYWKPGFWFEEEQMWRWSSQLRFRLSSRKWNKCFLSELETVMFEIIENTERQHESKKRTSAEKLLMERLQWDGFPVLAWLLGTHFVKSREYSNIARNKEICLRNSAYVFICRALTIKDLVKCGFVEFVDDGWRLVQRAVATKPFYGSSAVGHKTVLVSNEKQEIIYKHICSQGNISLSLEEMLAFLTLVSDASGNGFCPKHRTRSCSKCAYDAGKKHCYINWY